MALETKPYKGTRDFYPEDKRVQKFIFNKWREVVESFGYVEYDSPILEPAIIYSSKTSQEIVSQQTYSFTDRGGREVTIRPEMTPSVSRMVAGRRQDLAYPLRWYSIPNLWRYERPQKGRLREHWQLNVDLFGIDGIEADHEIISITNKIMQNFGASEEYYKIKINSRKLINNILSAHLKVPDNDAIEAVRLIDRKDKISSSEFTSQLNNIVGNQADHLIELLKITNLDQLPETIKNDESREKLKKLMVMLARSGVVNAQFDITLMRGFDYYTDIVFEIYDVDPDNSRSIFGGGRYDGLVGLFGVEPLPTVGFGLGDVTFENFLETHKLLPSLKNDIDIDVILLGDVYLNALNVIEEMRLRGLKVAVDPTKRKIDKQIKSAAKAGFEWVIFIGEEELKTNVYRLKNLKNSTEQALSVDEIVRKLK